MYKVIFIQRQIISTPGVGLGYTVVHIQSSKGQLPMISHLCCLDYVAKHNKQTENEREEYEWYSWREINVDDIFETPSLTDSIVLPQDENNPYEKGWLRNHLDLIYNMLIDYSEFFEI